MSAAARERLAAVGHMASLIGHKARNRLALVRAGLELLTIGAESALSSEHRAALLAQFDQFLGDFNLGIDMVRCDFGHPETGLLRDMVIEAVESFRPHGSQTGMEVASEFGARFGAPAEEPDLVTLDRRLLRMVLINLLRNAQEAGAVRASVTTRFARGSIVIDVADDGPGLDAGVATKIFREPVTTRPDGTGLGLTLCRDAASTMGGRIRLLRTTKGATFRLTLPA